MPQHCSVVTHTPSHTQTDSHIHMCIVKYEYSSINNIYSLANVWGISSSCGILLPHSPATSNDYEFAAIKDKHCVGAAAALGREWVCVPDVYRVRCTGCWILLTLPAHSLVRSALEAHFNGFYGKAKNINQMGKYYWQNMRLSRCDFYCHPLPPSHPPLPVTHFWFLSVFGHVIFASLSPVSISHCA